MNSGDVYWVVAARGRGSEQHGDRPFVVVQREDLAVLSTRLCVPTSRSAQLTSWRVEVEVAQERTIALTEQLRSLSVERLTRPAGRLSSDDLRDVVMRIRDLLPRA